jgi:hypothetical protein
MVCEATAGALLIRAAGGYLRFKNVIYKSADDANLAESRFAVEIIGKGRAILDPASKVES